MKSETKQHHENNLINSIEKQSEEMHRCLHIKLKCQKKGKKYQDCKIQAKCEVRDDTIQKSKTINKVKK